MRAAIWYGPYDIRVTSTTPHPQLHEARDAIIRVTCSAICGTDLHPYRGEIAGFPVGTVMGHEFTGIVEEVGSRVEQVRRGDRVLASDVIACGSCWYCRRGWHYQCQHVSLFGYGTIVGPYIPGGQAEYVHVPYADVVLSKTPASLEDEQILFVGDILTTGFACASEAHITPGDTVAVVGCGPVGLLALMSAYQFGASRVLAIDPDSKRRGIAEQLGGSPVIADEHVIDRVRALTHGHGADVVLEAVGNDQALVTALDIVRPRGTISIVGAHSSQAMPFSTQKAFAKELNLRFVVGNPIQTREQLVPLLEAGRIDPTRIISHRLPLSAASEGYRLFDQREAIKVVLQP